MNAAICLLLLCPFDALQRDELADHGSIDSFDEIRRYVRGHARHVSTRGPRVSAWYTATWTFHRPQRTTRGIAQGFLRQCWHWFDGEAAAREAERLLKPGGRLVIAHFNYLVTESKAAAATEELILAHHPTWEMAGGDGLLECWRPAFAVAGFGDVESFWYDEPVVYSHEDWCGRMRACNGVLALRDPARIVAFDKALRQRLAAEFPDPITIPHRVFVIRGTKPSADEGGIHRTSVASPSAPSGSSA